MKKNDIIEMARKAGLINSYGGRETASNELLEAFAKLVAAKERKSFDAMCKDAYEWAIKKEKSDKKEWKHWSGRARMAQDLGAQVRDD